MEFKKIGHRNINNGTTLLLKFIINLIKVYVKVAFIFTMCMDSRMGDNISKQKTKQFYNSYISKLMKILCITSKRKATVNHPHVL